MSERDRERAVDKARREVRLMTGFSESELAPLLKSGDRNVTHEVTERFENEAMALFKRYLVEYPELHWVTLLGSLEVIKFRVTHDGMDYRCGAQRGDEDSYGEA